MPNSSETRKELIKTAFLNGETLRAIARTFKIGSKPLMDFLKSEGFYTSTDDLLLRRLNLKHLGKQFNNYTVLEIFPLEKQNPKPSRKCRCQCTCGNLCEISLNLVIKKKLKFCKKCYSMAASNNPQWKGHGEISAVYFASCRRGALQRNLNFSITIEYIWDLFLKQNRRCALSGVELRFKWRSNGTASLDRIDSSKGYVEGNLQWLHKDVNLMKNNKSEPYFLEWIEKIHEHQSQAKP